MEDQPKTQVHLPGHGVIEQPDYLATVDGYERPVLSPLRRNSLIALWCLVEFLDTSNNTALFPALTRLITDLNTTQADIVWIFAAYSATFAGFQLISGRISDVYGAKWVFTIGCLIVGVFQLGCGFVDDGVTMFVLRAIAGIGAAMTIPSALSLIVEWIPDPNQQNHALALFGACAAIGGVFGIFVGAVFVQLASWRWVYWFTAILGIPMAVLSIILTPPTPPRKIKGSWRRLDLGGASLVVVSLVLLIYGLTSGSATGWKSAKAIAPIIISVFVFIAFLLLEAKLDVSLASMPPYIWRYPNVGVLAGMALYPLFWWIALYYLLVPYFEDQMHWNPIMSSVHLLPAALSAAVVGIFAGHFPKYIHPKRLLIISLCLNIIATLLLPFATTRERYWSLMFPAFIIGTTGTMLCFTAANIAIFMNTPPEIAGIVGAVFNSSVQVGAAVGESVIATITSTYDRRNIQLKGVAGYEGIAKSFWFLLAFTIAELISCLVFYKVAAPTVRDSEKGENAVQGSGDSTAANSAEGVAAPVSEKPNDH